MHLGNPVLNIQIRGQCCINGLVNIYLLNVPSFSSRYFNKIKRTTRLGRLLALSLEILCPFLIQSKKGCKDQESIQSSTPPDPQSHNTDFQEPGVI